MARKVTQATYLTIRLVSAFASCIAWKGKKRSVEWMEKTGGKLAFLPLMYGVERKFVIGAPSTLSLKFFSPSHCERRGLWKLIVMLLTLPLHSLNVYTMTKITRA